VDARRSRYRRVAMSKQFTARLFGWRDQILRNEKLPPSAFKVAYFLSQKFNENEGGLAWPSCATIGAATGLSEPSVLRLVGQLEAHGHLVIEAGQQGRGHSNRYRMVLKPPLAEVLSTLKPPSPEVLRAPKTSICDELKPPSLEKKPPFETGKTSAAGSDSSKEESMNSLRRENLPASELFKDDASIESPVASIKHTGASAAALNEDFDLFWFRCPRKVGKAAARVAFIKAVKSGADPEVIVEGIARYARERAGQDERYTAHPKTWLREERWTDEPARSNGAVVTLDNETGAVIEVAQPAAREGRFGSFAEAAAARRAEAQRGRN
jgi:hypothetical protein